MKGITRKLFAVMIAAALVLQPCTTVTAADRQMSEEIQESAAETGEPVSDQTVSDTVKELKEDTEEPSQDMLQNRELISDHLPEESSSVREEAGESVEAEETSVEKTAEIPLTASRIIVVDKDTTVEMRSLRGYEVYGTLIASGDVYTNQNINVYSGGVFIIKGGEFSADDDRAINVYSGGTLIVEDEEDIYIDNIIVAEDAEDTVINIGGGDIRNISLEGNPRNLDLTVSAGSVDSLEIQGYPENSAINITGGTVELINISEMPEDITIKVTEGEVWSWRFRDPSEYLPNVIITNTGKVNLPFDCIWKHNEDGTYSFEFQRQDITIEKGGTMYFYDGEYEDRTFFIYGEIVVNGGYIKRITAMDGGRIDVKGGEVGEISIDEEANNAQINISGGTIGKITYNGQGNIPQSVVFSIADISSIQAPEGYVWVSNENGTYRLMSAAAQIDETVYETLEEAFAAAEDGDTIMLLKDCAGNGIKVPQGKFDIDGLIVDFGGHTYTVDGETVGSTGTETNGFQLLRDNKITFTGGTITSEKAKILIQNYSDLTLEGMTLELNNEDYTSAYTLSNNNGNVLIDSTEIHANPAGGFAFDVCRYASYPSVYVTVTGESLIDGNIEVYASNGDAADGFVLMLESGEFTGDIILDETAMNAMDVSPLTTGVIRNREEVVIDSPDGYSWEEYDGTYDILRTDYAAKNLTTGKRYSAFSEALDEAESGQTVIPLRDLDNEGFILVMNGVTLDLNGYRITGAKLFYVTGVLKDSGEMKGGFSAQAYYMAGAGADSWFPIYDAEEELYRLYDLGVTTWDPSSSAGAYAFRFSNTADREEAKTAIAESAYGRVEAVICIRWKDSDEQHSTKYVSFDDSFMDTYCTSERNLAFTVSFTGLDTKPGPITATPMFIVYDADGSSRGIMSTLPGQTWTIKE